MSLINVLLHGDAAYVAVDTAVIQFDTGAVFEGSKMVPMPSAGIVVAGQGTPDLIYHFAMSMVTCLRQMDFDAIQDASPGIDDWFRRVDAFYASQGKPDASPAHSGQRIVVAGWSMREQRMAGIQFNRPPGADTSFEVDRIEGQLHTPAYDDDLSGLTVATPEDYMRAVAEAQMRTHRKHKSQPVLGGRLIVAELRRSQVIVSDLGPILVRG